MLKRFRHDEKGAVMTAFAVGMIPIGLAIGGAVDFATVIKHRQQMQAQTDAAAIAAALALDGDKTTIAQAFFTNTATPSTVTAVANGDLVTVTATSTVKTPFLSIAGTQSMAATTKSVAARLRSGPPACLLALNKTVSGAITFSGSSLTVAKGCSIYSNSNSDSAISVAGSASVTADGFCSVGGFSGPADMNPKPFTHCYPAKDPFAAVATATSGGCSYNNLTVQPNKSKALSPGTYCGGLDIKGDATLDPGVYIIKDGGLAISSQSNVTGNGVTFVLTGKSAGFTINGGANIDLKATTSGSYAGILIFQDRASNAGAGNTLNGNSSTKLAGAIYTPTQTVTINGSGTFGQTNTYMPIIADQIKLTGNATAQADVTKMTSVAEIAKIGTSAMLLQ